jgi:hypothetical protein
MVYSLNARGFVVRDADGATIPAAPSNIDWQAYQAWLAAGNAPTPAPAVAPPIPALVTRRQFFQAAVQQGLIAQSDALALFSTGVVPANLARVIATLPTADQFAAELAVLGDQNFSRADPMVAEIGAAMGQTPAQIDALFVLAASL